MRTETPTHIELSLPYHFAPRSYQWPVWKAWDDGIRRFLKIEHRRAGKDKTLLNFCVERMLERKGNYFHIFPKLNQARRVIWTGIDRDGHSYLDHFPPELIYKRDQNEMSLTLINPAHPSEPGSIYQLLGTDRNLDVLVGANPVGVIFSEYALQNPRAWDLCRPILRENGGWAAFAYTPRGKNHGYRLYQQNRNNPEWFVSLLTVHDTTRDGAGESGLPVVSDADIDADRREGMDEALIQQEYFCSFDSAIAGAYYAKECAAMDKERRVTHVPYDPGYGVYTFWDIGVDDSTAIWCAQFIGRQICLIDYYEAHGYGLPHYADVLAQKSYSYRGHIFPHDVAVREWASGAKRVDTAERLLFGKVVVAPRLPFADGKDAVRLVFPRLLIDEQACERGIDAVRSYHQRYDEQAQKFLDEPDHDWSSHAADALRYCAVSLALVEEIEDEWRGREVSPQPKLPRDESWARGHGNPQLAWMG